MKSFMALLVVLFSVLSSPLLHAEQITIAVASNFTSAMKSIASEFEKETGNQVHLAFGSSGKFFAQIRNGAPYQAFFSADQAKPIALEKAGLIVPDSRFTYAIGALALWSPLPDKVDSTATLLQQGSFNKLALANPKLAPYGAAAVQVLQQLKLVESTKGKWILGENIAQTYQFVSTGNADIGFVALSQIMYKGKFKTGSAWLVPAKLHAPIRQDAVLLTKGQSSLATKALLSFIRSQKAHSIMANYGYQSPASLPK